jgi:hypothetical protein
LKLPSAHSRRFRGARVFVAAQSSCRAMVHDTPDKGNRRRVVILSEARNPHDIATSFRTWIEKPSFTPLSCGVSTPTIKQGRHGLSATPVRRDGRGGREDMPEACPYSNGVVAFPLLALRAPSWKKNAGQESGATGLVTLSEAKNPEHVATPFRACVKNRTHPRSLSWKRGTYRICAQTSPSLSGEGDGG